MRQKEKSQQSREDILMASLEEFGEKGYSGASLSHICRAKGITKGKIFYHFTGKEELFLSCASLCFQRAEEFIDREQPRQQGTPQERLFSYLQAMPRFMEENPTAQNLIFAAASDLPDQIREHLLKMEQRLQNKVGNQCRAILSELPLRQNVDMDLLMDYLSACVHYDLQRYGKCLGKNRPDLPISSKERQNNLKTLIEMILYGIVQIAEK